MSRDTGFPVYYVTEFTSLAGGGTATTTQVFNDPGVIRGVTFKASDSSGAVISADSFSVNIARQNQRGLTTGAVTVSAIAGTGERPYSLSPVLGDYRVSRNTVLTITLKNLTSSTTATLAHVVFVLHADTQDR
jgi:hypothetical protein